MWFLTTVLGVATLRAGLCPQMKVAPLWFSWADFNVSGPLKITDSSEWLWETCPPVYVGESFAAGSVMIFFDPPMAACSLQKLASAAYDQMEVIAWGVSLYSYKQTDPLPGIHANIRSHGDSYIERPFAFDAASSAIGCFGEKDGSQCSVSPDQTGWYFLRKYGVVAPLQISFSVLFCVIGLRTLKAITRTARRFTLPRTILILIILEIIFTVTLLLDPNYIYGIYRVSESFVLTVGTFSLSQTSTILYLSHIYQTIRLKGMVISSFVDTSAKIIIIVSYLFITLLFSASMWFAFSLNGNGFNMIVIITSIQYAVLPLILSFSSFFLMIYSRRMSSRITHVTVKKLKGSLTLFGIVKLVEAFLGVNVYYFLFNPWRYIVYLILFYSCKIGLLYLELIQFEPQTVIVSSSTVSTEEEGSSMVSVPLSFLKEVHKAYPVTTTRELAEAVKNWANTDIFALFSKVSPYPPTVFVSQAQDCSFLRMIEALNEFEKAQNKKYRYWIDIFCIDQSQVEAEIENIPHVIESIGSVLVVLDPWDKPVSLTRAWCLFEIAVAHSSGCSIVMTMSPDQIKLLQESMTKNYRSILKLVTKTSVVEKASCFMEQDRLRILEFIQNKYSSYKNFDYHVTEALQRAYTQSSWQNL